MTDKGHIGEARLDKIKPSAPINTNFVLEKDIFSNIFEKDIRRVFIYKKAERLAKAIHLVTPAFAQSPSLRDRLDSVAIGLIDAAILPTGLAKEKFSRELLTLSSVLSIARSGGMLSLMNVTLITNEAHALLAEVAVYEEPRLFLDDSPTLADLAKDISKYSGEARALRKSLEPRANRSKPAVADKGHLSDIKVTSERRDTILSLMKDKGVVYIKDISTVFREVSEKTIQRELQRLVQEGIVAKKGSRRWTEYTLI